MKNSISLKCKLILVGATLFLFNPQLFSQWTRNAATTSVSLQYNSDRVGIGTSTPPPPGVKLDLGGNMSINGNNILLRGGNDNNHGLGWFGSPKLFAGQSLDGPILYGWDGGALGYVNNSLQKIVLRWNSNGNVGIGTSTPEDRLQVGNGVGKLVIGEAYTVNLNYATAYLGFNASRQNTGTWSIAGDGAHNGGTIIYSNIFGDIYFSTFPSNGPSNRTGIPDININNNAKMIIAANGNVGINSFSPAQKLDVNGNVSINNHAILLHWNNDENHGLRYAGVGYPFANNTTIDGPALYGYSGGVLGLKNIAGNTEKTALRWDINGNVGIGTDLASNSYNTIANYFKLSVNGSVRAKEVVVETGWADFVFEKNYRLKSLGEIEKYIAQNGRLPDVPSASEIEKNGANVGEILKLQMQKIEELTLYMIEQDKKIQQMQQELNALKERKQATHSLEK